MKVKKNMIEQAENTLQDSKQTSSKEKNSIGDVNDNTTNLQDDAANTSEDSPKSDNVSEDLDNIENEEVSYKEKYEVLNDTYLRLIAEFDNFRKRTIREKADLIKSGGATVLTNLLPVIDDFERALNTLQNTEDLTAATEGVKLIYDKFISYLSQQGVKVIEAVGQPFDTEYFEAIATIPASEKNMKGKVIDCVQTGYSLYDKVLRHSKVVVGE